MNLLRRYIKSKKIIIGGMVVLLVVSFSLAFSVLLKKDRTISVTGLFTLGDFTKFGNLQSGERCSGSGGYSDINPQTQVVTYDRKGTLLAITQLGQGSADGSGNCSFKFLLNKIPESAFYRFEIANRGELSFSKQELASRNYNLYFSLGDVEEQPASINGEPQYLTLPTLDQALKSIKNDAQKKWGEDYRMIQYEISLQTDSYNWLTSIQSNNPKILQWSLNKWGNDFRMVKYEYEQQLEAFDAL